MRALIVDDSSTVRSIIAKFLASWGIDSVQAGNGHEALTMLERNQDVSVALVDWNMPIMSGIEFVRQVRKSSLGASLKVIMVTTETEMSQVVAALEAGVDEYIMKPFTREIFQEKLAMAGVFKPDQESAV